MQGAMSDHTDWLGQSQPNPYTFHSWDTTCAKCELWPSRNTLPGKSPLYLSSLYFLHFLGQVLEAHGCGAAVGGSPSTL
jgi:hypothetical protein